MKGFVTVLFVFLSVAIFAQKPAHLVKPSDTLNKEAFINTVDQSLMLFYQDYASKQEYDSIIKLLNYESTDLPKFTDEEYCARLEEMNKMSPSYVVKCDDDFIRKVDAEYFITKEEWRERRLNELGI